MTNKHYFTRLLRMNESFEHLSADNHFRNVDPIGYEQEQNAVDRNAMDLLTALHRSLQKNDGAFRQVGTILTNMNRHFHGSNNAQATMLLNECNSMYARKQKDLGHACANQRSSVNTVLTIAGETAA